MSNLACHRCFNHAAREAAARCPECGRCFCRECTTEHRGRIICAHCLSVRRDRQGWRGAWRAALGRAFLLALVLSLSWSVFALGGRILLLIPSEFHDSTLWVQEEEPGP